MTVCDPDAMDVRIGSRCCIALTSSRSALRNRALNSRCVRAVLIMRSLWRIASVTRIVSPRMSSGVFIMLASLAFVFLLIVGIPDR
ncbi:hypothetical protein DVR11_03135 [Paracoccus versutus]|nr:hypothetical protein DVR11_03135 [Paracoccus versutus]